MAAKSSFAGLSLFFTCGALLLLFLVLLGGVVDHVPPGLVYFLEADTSGIPGAPDTSRWTFWNICTVRDDGHNRCGNVHPAFPLDPPSHRNFGTHVDVPAQFIGTHKYFYLTRFMFAFNLITIFFAVMAFFTSILALCSRIGSYISAFLNIIALFFLTLTDCLMTAAYVIGRDNFHKNKQSAKLGKYAFGFMWAAWACLLISIVLVCSAGRGAKDKTTYKSTSTKKGFLGGRFGGGPKRSKSTRSRGSFVEGRIKDDYA